MRTLVIHPVDRTTDFLSIIWTSRNWTVFRGGRAKDLKELIKNHDRVIMLGHGTKDGLIEAVHKKSRFIVDSKMVYLLRDKICVCIWCNADEFVSKYRIKSPLFTGMIISEVDEAIYYNVDYTYEGIQLSNRLFANSVSNYIDSDRCAELVRDAYGMEADNQVIIFNKQNIYGT